MLEPQEDVFANMSEHVRNRLEPENRATDPMESLGNALMFIAGAGLLIAFYVFVQQPRNDAAIRQNISEQLQREQREPDRQDLDRAVLLE